MGRLEDLEEWKNGRLEEWSGGVLEYWSDGKIGRLDGRIEWWSDCCPLV